MPPPAFYFTLTPIQPSHRAPRRVTSRGRWLPPQRQGYNLQAEQTTLFFFNGSTTEPRQNLTGDIHIYRIYRQFSVYHDHAYFWCVEKDAIAQQIGNGLDNSAHRGEQYQDEEEDSSAEEEEGGRSDSADAPDDWSKLSFDHIDRGRSYAGVDKEYQDLAVIQEDSHWPDQLLPDTYGADERTDTPRRGGLVGDLPLLIALMAFSLPPNDVTAYLPPCIASPSWRVYGPNQFSRGAGWRNQRGIVVKVYYDSDLVTEEELSEYEDGRRGTILP
ncbi:hypothetical protein LTR86_003694 [Recurvomyces mirabilis]|nr:hypothetical protein LTR86_003694 [Recurvomyces mirabilis]